MEKNGDAKAMIWNGLAWQMKTEPPLDADFVPFMKILLSHQKSASLAGGRIGDRPGNRLAISIRKPGGHVSVYEMFVHSTPEMEQANRIVVERVLKFLLWMKGGNEITVYGDEGIGSYLHSQYSGGGRRAFDAQFMAKVYERDFSVRSRSYAETPVETDEAFRIGGNTGGCRIGFDAGGSDRKVSAVVDGDTVFSEEVVWRPKVMSDPEYHYGEILSALKKAKEYLPRVDSIGVSSAGIYVDNRCKVSSLFLKVPPELFNQKIEDIYIRAAAEIGAPVTVVNDGDVAALAGAMGLAKNNILGVAMGTSEAAGFVDASGNIRGWLNELAFAPVDFSPSAARDEWSGDVGCGVKYFSQDGVIRLALKAGLVFERQATPAEKLEAVQGMMSSPSRAARRTACDIYESIGVYLGHAAALYSHFYGMENMLVMGRVLSGRGGEIIVDTAREVLRSEYPEQDYADKVSIALPNEKTRRVGQSIAAASL